MEDSAGASTSISPELSAVLEAQKNAILSAVNSQIQGLQTNLLQAQSDLAVQIATDLQPDNYVFKKKGNEQQFSFNRKVAKTSNSALKALEGGNIPKAKEELNKGISLLNNRQKIIKLADKSEFGSATVQEYVCDDLADDEADASKINNYVCPPICLIPRVLLHMRNCKASGTLIVPLWHSAPFWLMISAGGDKFSDFVVDWMDLPSLKEAFIPGRCNSVFGSENFNFRMLALRIHFV